MNYLCDTNVLAELARPRPDAGAVAWAESVRRMFLSVITLEEIEFGLGWHPNSRVLAWMEQFLERRCEIVPVTATMARKAGQLRGQLRSKGSARTQADMLIAATAACTGLILVTRNARDFHGCGIAVMNPFARA